MTARAPFRQADLDRAMKAASKAGYEVRIEGGVIRLLPTGPDARPSSAILSAEEAEAAWDKALGTGA
jgi:hypothetical protein